jgi:hypothetical protein
MLPEDIGCSWPVKVESRPVPLGPTWKAREIVRLNELFQMVTSAISWDLVLRVACS